MRGKVRNAEVLDIRQRLRRLLEEARDERDCILHLQLEFDPSITCSDDEEDDSEEDDSESSEVHK